MAYGLLREEKLKNSGFAGIQRINELWKRESEREKDSEKLDQSRDMISAKEKELEKNKNNPVLVKSIWKFLAQSYLDALQLNARFLYRIMVRGKISMVKNKETKKREKGEGLNEIITEEQKKQAFIDARDAALVDVKFIQKKLNEGWARDHQENWVGRGISERELIIWSKAHQEALDKWAAMEVMGNYFIETVEELESALFNKKVFDENAKAREEKVNDENVEAREEKVDDVPEPQDTPKDTTSSGDLPIGKIVLLITAVLAVGGAVSFLLNNKKEKKGGKLLYGNQQSTV